MNAPPFEMVGMGFLIIGFVLIGLVVIGFVIGYGIQWLIKRFCGE